MMLLQEIFLICSSKQISRAVNCWLLKVKTCLKRLNKMLQWETESISSDNNTLLMSKRGCHTLLSLTQLKIVILLGHSTENCYIIRMEPENSKRGGGWNWSNRASLPPHSPVGQQGTSRDNNSFFLYLNKLFIVFPKSTQAQWGELFMSYICHF